MQAQLYISTILVVLSCCGNPLEVAAARLRMPSFPKEMEKFNCRNESLGVHLDLSRLSGYWYEAGRVPNVQVLECLNVSVPAEIDNNILSLDLNFINTVNNDWSFTQEAVDFPWNNETQAGVFNLHFDTVTVTYKLVLTDYDNVAFVCGYGSISPVPLFKLFTRARQIDPNTMALVQSFAEQYGVASQIAWEKQSPDQCNGSRDRAPLAVLMGFIALLWFLSPGTQVRT
ncbi:uncharacterized protein LOC108026059 [Drosophila biarmipes]|uniref:uncharacterized protein LOC108026059 n=1 Tax=Drosophila biarmipes TaxID=125945 RepID=UPI0007E70A85|nr:uncharacterized protein LOC108026059 [Drosophila biarmipes]